MTFGRKSQDTHDFRWQDTWVSSFVHTTLLGGYSNDHQFPARIKTPTGTEHGFTVRGWFVGFSTGS